MATHINRDVLAADLFIELSEQGKGEAIYESSLFESHVLTSVVGALTNGAEGERELGKAVADCVREYVSHLVDEEMASFELKDYPAEHDAAHASGLIDRENADQHNKRI